MSGIKCCDGYICCLCKKEEVIDIGINFNEEKNLYIRGLSDEADISLVVNSSNFYVKDIFSEIERHHGARGVFSLSFSMYGINELVCTFSLDNNLCNDLFKYQEYDLKFMIIPGDLNKSDSVLSQEQKNRAILFESYEFFKKQVGKLSLEDIYKRDINNLQFDQVKSLSLKRNLQFLYKDLNEGELTLRDQTNLCLLFCSISIIAGGFSGYFVGCKLVNQNDTKSFEYLKTLGCLALGSLFGLVVNLGPLCKRDETKYSLNRVKGIIKNLNATSFKNFICDDLNVTDSDANSDCNSDSDFSFVSKESFDDINEISSMYSEMHTPKVGAISV